MASIGSEHAPRSYWRLPSRLSWSTDLAGTISRLRALFTDGSESSLARRLAGAAFLISVASALIAFISQILWARWMGGFEFGIYIYAWTWVLLIGGMVDLGLGSASQRLIPEYTEHRQFALLRGSRYLAGAIASAVGEPTLRLFGRDFVSGYYLMFIIATGLLARAAVGPAERLLNMRGERRSCALVYAGSFFIDLALCVALIPWLGIAGAAIANAVALIFESASLFFVAKYRLELHCLIFGLWQR